MFFCIVAEVSFQNCKSDGVSLLSERDLEVPELQGHLSLPSTLCFLFQLHILPFFLDTLTHPVGLIELLKTKQGS